MEPTAGQSHLRQKVRSNLCSRFSHGEPDPVQQLSIQMDSFAFDQSEAGSEGSYDTSLGSFEDSNYNVLVETPGYLDPAAPTFYSASPYWEPGLVTILPTTTQQYCDHTLEVSHSPPYIPLILRF